MVRAGLARALRLFVAVAGGTAIVSVLAGLAFGTGLDRALSLGWYCAGAFALLVGFVASSRGPTRSAETLSSRVRARRWATRDEQEESINLSAVIVALGFLLIVLGVLADRRHPLF
jgi:hypothetical protein